MFKGLAALAAGLGVGVFSGNRAAGPTLVPWPGRIRAAFPLVIGGLVGVSAANTAGVALYRPTGFLRPKTASIALAGLAAGAVSARVARQRVLDSLAATGRAIEPGFASPPTSELVSGGPGSHVDYSTVGREGARFLSAVTSAASIRQVLGSPATHEPIRIFVGVESAETVEMRVSLAMAELRRTGAFDRGTLLIQAPAGTGYANSTPIDVTEIMTAGDCASVVIGYGLLPSFLSLNKVGVASQTQRLLLDAIVAELATRSKRPRIFLYGESLGAKVQQAAIPAGLPELIRIGVDRALWVGTPGSKNADMFAASVDGHSFTLDRPEQIANAVGDPFVWFLQHDGDPVVRFRSELIYQRPAWLPTDGERGRHVPEEMEWTPLVTWAQVLVDTLFATNIKPGDFQSIGHDYRADLGAVTVAAYGWTPEADLVHRLDEYLRASEVEKARLVGE